MSAGKINYADTIRTVIANGKFEPNLSAMRTALVGFANEFRQSKPNEDQHSNAIKALLKAVNSQLTSRRLELLHDIQEIGAFGGETKYSGELIIVHVGYTDGRTTFKGLTDSMTYAFSAKVSQGVRAKVALAVAA